MGTFSSGGGLLEGFLSHILVDATCPQRGVALGLHLPIGAQNTKNGPVQCTSDVKAFGVGRHGIRWLPNQ
jgi:hypothetical protein